MTMIGMKFTGLLFLLFYCPTSAVKITCDAPSVRDGQPATVTCDFKRDVSALSSATVTVEHYPEGSAEPTPVLECTPVGAACKLPVPGYEFNGQINTKLVLNITSASKKNSGRFACKMLSPDPAETDEVDPCDFTVIVVGTTTSTTPYPNITTTPDPTPGGIDIALIVGLTVAGIVIVALAIIIVCIIRKRRWLCFSGPPTTSPNLSNELDDRPNTTEVVTTEKKALIPPTKSTSELDDRPNTTMSTEGATEKKALIPPTKNTEEGNDDGSEPQDSPSQRRLETEKTTSQQETAENGDLTSEGIPTQQNKVVDDPTSAENGDFTPQGTPKQQKEVVDDPTSHTDDDETGAQTVGFNEASERVPENEGSQEDVNSGEKEDQGGEEPKPGHVKDKTIAFEHMQNP